MIRTYLFLLLIGAAAVTSSCGGIKNAESKVLFASNSNECKVLLAVENNSSVANKGYGTLTITHPEIVSNFNFTKVLGKFSQINNLDDQQEVVRRIIRSFLTTKVAGIAHEQPLRPFVIPELFCPLLSASQRASQSFCGAEFFSDPPAAIAKALAFIDRREVLGNYAAIDKILAPLTFIKRPPRVDLDASEQSIEARVIFGLRDETGQTRKPATIILEFAGTSQQAFYENLVQLFLKFKDLNNSDARRQWAQGIEAALDSFIRVNASSNHWRINQLRINELAFRGDDILWDFREFQFPSPTSAPTEFVQVPVANTPFVDFNAQDKNAADLQPGFDKFLSAKGMSAGDLDADQSIDIFEEFLANPKLKVNNNDALQSFVNSSLNNLKNDSGSVGSKAFAFHKDQAWMSPAALARPGMKFFDNDLTWSKTMKETCQGCHVATSSIAGQEGIDSTQGFYHVSPRKLPLDASAGVERAGGNLLSNFLLRETELRFKSVLKLVGCLDPAPQQPDPGNGDSSGTTRKMNSSDRSLVSVNSYACENMPNDTTLTQCTRASTVDSYMCATGHTELLRCLDPDGSYWLIACEDGPIRKIARPTVLNSCQMPLPER